MFFFFPGGHFYCVNLCKLQEFYDPYFISEMLFIGILVDEMLFTEIHVN